MRIDSHVHLWRYNEAEYAWITDEMAAIKRDFMPEDWRTVAEPLGFEGFIAVQARQTFEETLWLLELAGEHEVIRGVVGWVDLRNPAVDEHLEILCDHTKLAGVRHVVQDEPDPRLMLQSEFLRGVGKLGRCDLTYDILVYARQLPAAAEMVGHFPRQRFVLDHIGKPDIRAGEIDAWASGIRALAEHENVWCKLSGMVTEAQWDAWTPESLRPYLDVVFEAFGPERLMIGADWPACLVAGSYAETVGVVLDYITEMPEEHRRAIVGENCARAYQTGEA
ncbi:MAG: amidohydrolase family protein [Armatimonadota bacterium]|jgi:L-fuconolactonase